MLFLALIFYSILWFPLLGLFILSGGLHVPVLVLPFALYLFCLLLIWFVFRFLLGAGEVGEERGSTVFLRNLAGLRGVRGYTLWTVVIIVLYSLAFVILHETGMLRLQFRPALAGFFIPFLGVYVANLLGFELLPRCVEGGRTVEIPVHVPGEPEGNIKKLYTWTSNGRVCRVELLIRRSVYEGFKNRARSAFAENWAEECVAGGICGEIMELAAKLSKLTGKFGTIDEVQFVLSFVHGVVEYTEDPVFEYPRFPVETLVEQQGDCEDCAILGAALLKVMGYDVALLILPQHAALGVAGVEGLEGFSIEHNGKRYYYCEMTGSGWRVGQLPQDAEGVDIEVYPVPGLKLTT